MEKIPTFEEFINESKNKRKVVILGLPDKSVPDKIFLQRFCKLRSAEKIGDVEVINNTQLGYLKDQGVIFDIIEESYMSDLDVIAKESDSFDDFVNTVIEEYPKIKKNKSTLKWLKEIYDNSSQYI